MAMFLKLAVLLLSCSVAQASLTLRTGSTVNPIRRVVTMLQMMQNKVTEEGKKAEALYDKYMCYCENADATLGKSIADAETKIPQLEASIKENAALKEQLTADIAQHKTDRADAKTAMAEATALRNKENGAFEKESSDFDSYIAALGKAVAALEKGVAGGFLQTTSATVLRRLSTTMDMSAVDRNMLAAFLSEGSSDRYVPQSQEIIGILKQMKDEMEKDLADAKAAEAEALANFESLMDAKTKEINAATKAIEEKLSRTASLGVELAESKNDLEDTQQGLEEDKKFLADLKGNCDAKKAEWAEYKKTQADELVALAETIKILNDDDAMELFKKTLPTPSLLQLKATAGEVSRRALAVLANAPRGDRRLDMLELALHGKKAGFEKVVKMIDELVALLAKEQADDDAKKDWCDTEFDTSDDQKKALEHDVTDLEKAIADATETVATLTGELAALADAIKALDKQVAEQTEQRKAEHADFNENLAANNAANDLLEFAKNRLNKFYNLPREVHAAQRQVEKRSYAYINEWIRTGRKERQSGPGSA